MADEAPKTKHEAASNSDLMASAKTVAEAAQLACTQKTDQIDKAKVSEAAEDVLEAAKSYGKLDDKSGVGQYVDKAEGYLHKFHAESATPGGAENKETEGEKKESSASDGAEKEKEKSSGGPMGGLMNMAKGLF